VTAEPEVNIGSSRRGTFMTLSETPSKDREVAGFSYLFHFDQLPIGLIKIVCLQQEKWISEGKTFDILCLFCRSYQFICA
jgi:hypothetical protein